MDHFWAIPKIKKGSSPGLLCVACLQNRLKHKYGLNLWKMSKIGQNPWTNGGFPLSSHGWQVMGPKEVFFFLIFSARGDLVKVSWKSDARKCQNLVTPPNFDRLNERYKPLCGILNRDLGRKSIIMDGSLTDKYTCNDVDCPEHCWHPEAERKRDPT